MHDNLLKSLDIGLIIGHINCHTDMVEQEGVVSSSCNRRIYSSTIALGTTEESMGLPPTALWQSLPLCGHTLNAGCCSHGSSDRKLKGTGEKTKTKPETTCISAWLVKTFCTLVHSNVLVMKLEVLLALLQPGTIIKVIFPWCVWCQWSHKWIDGFDVMIRVIKNCKGGNLELRCECMCGHVLL